MTFAACYFRLNWKMLSEVRFTSKINNKEKEQLTPEFHRNIADGKQIKVISFRKSHYWVFLPWKLQEMLLRRQGSRRKKKCHYMEVTSLTQHKEVLCHTDYRHCFQRAGSSSFPQLLLYIYI